MRDVSIPGGAQAVERALGILEYVASQPVPVTVNEIARGLELHRNTAYRLARTLTAWGYLEADNGAYALGPRVAAIARSESRLNRLVRRSDPILQAVCEATSEVVNLGIRRGDEVFYLGRWEGAPQRTGVYVRTGQQAPLYASALGKVLLSGMAPQARTEYYGRCPFTAYTAYTITDPEELEHVVQGVRASGYAEDVEELSEGVRCVAVPIVVSNLTIAAVSIAAPAMRMTPATVLGHRRLLIEAAGQIGEALTVSSRDAV